MRHLRTARLAKWHIWFLSLAGTALWLSGAAWLLLHYYGRTEGDFGPQVNPLEPWMMKLHGAAVMAALLAIGGLFIVHIPKGWSHAAQRAAGIALSALLVLLMASGYLLYYAADEDLRGWVSLIHWAPGLGAPVIFVWHYVNGQKLRNGRRGRR